MSAHRTVTTPDGTTLAVYESGPATGPVVVAVHGYPDDHTVWDGVAAELDDRFRVVTYDVRGAGASDRPTARTAYRMDALIADLAAVLDAVSPGRPVHLLAHDWGSIQCWAALTDPRLTGRIIGYTSVSGPSLDQSAVWLRGLTAHPRAALGQLARSYYTMLFQVPRLGEAAVRLGVIDRAVGRTTGAHDGDRRADQLHGLNLYRANMGRHLGRPSPRHVDIPVQVLAPSGDSYVTPALATGAPQAWVRDLRTRVIPGHHWVVRRRPDVIAAAVREFADHLDGAPETRTLATARRRAPGLFGGQLVVVTGGGRGIGRATALEFARHGADVIVADINDVAAKEVVLELTALGVTAAAYHLDVADPAAWDEFAAAVRDEHGVPDVIVNNAGIGMSGPFLSTTVDDWRRILDINLWGVIHGARLFGAQLVERGHGGHIVNIASAAAYSPSMVYPAYATTKAAVLMLTECLRAELDGQGIGVTAICPGFVDSDISRTTVHVGVNDETQQALREHAVASYRRRNYPPERLARHIVRATQRNTPVAAISAESKVFRALTRYAPPLARRVARIDLNKL